MLDDCHAAHFGHYVCIDDQHSRPSADLLAGVSANQGGALAKACIKSTVILTADSTAQPLGMPPARPRVEVAHS
jgi:hypothetical protein